MKNSGSGVLRRMAARSPGISIVFLLGISDTPLNDFFDFAARRHLDDRRALLHFPNRFVAVQGVEADRVRQKQPRLDFQAAIDVDVLGQLGHLGSMDFRFEFRILRSLFRFGLVRGVPVHQTCGNFLPLRSLHAPVTHPVAFHRVLARQLKCPVRQDQFLAFGKSDRDLARTADAFESASCCAAKGGWTKVPDRLGSTASSAARRITICAGNFMVSVSDPLPAQVLRCQ